MFYIGWLRGWKKGDFQRIVADALTKCSLTRNLPATIIVDNGSEFISKALDAWAYRNGVRLDFIRPGKPVENAYIESFNARLRDECLNQNMFLDLHDARTLLEEWREDYNEARPHSSLNNLTALLKSKKSTIEISEIKAG